MQVSAGEVHTLALTAEGAVLSWGSNLQRQCGRAFEEPLLTAPGVVPLPLEPGERVLHVHAGGYRGALVTSLGRLLSLGLGLEHEQRLDEIADEADAAAYDDDTEPAVRRVPQGHAPSPDVDVEPDNFDDEDEF